MTDATSARTIEALLQHAIQIEERAKALYLELVRRFSHHPASATLWQTLADDEAAHVRELVNVLESAKPEMLARPASAETWSTVVRMQELIDPRLLDSITNLKDAYGIAHQLEFSEVNAVFEFLAADIVPGNVEREFVRTHIREHQRRLLDFSENYIGENWEKVIPQ